MTDQPYPAGAQGPPAQMTSVLRGFDSSLPIALLRARAATAHKFKRHTDALGLTQPQWRVVRALAPGVPLDVRTLADRCALLQPSVSRLLKSLEERGFIQTLPGEDGRRRLLTLTDRGRAVFNVAAVISEAVYRDIEAAYGREELDLLVRMLTRLREVAESLPDLPHEMPPLPPLPPDF
ncbi:MAG: MarR family transcriptional regulator [Rhodobacterales bacterium]|nr:MarR family transcriptional regulator [Rhodobacterales bacterium]MDX5498633.1 MarR family transcriptional regulator [Rhodobacterales bacterium]